MAPSAAARFEVRQLDQLTVRRPVLSQAVLVVVRKGTKVVRLPNGHTLRAEAGEALAASAGERS